MDSYIVCRYLKASVINMQMHHEKKIAEKQDVTSAERK